MLDASTLGVVTLPRKADLSLFAKSVLENPMHALTIDKGIDTLIERTIDTGGASVSMLGNPVPDSGYMVGGYVDSLIFDKDVLTHGNTAWQMIVKFIENHFPLATKFSMFVGAWIDTDTDLVYVDISQHFPADQLSDAKAVASFHDEIAIWDLATNSEIRI